MTQEQFDNYNFSVGTVIKIKNEIITVLKVDFVERTINNIPIIAIDNVYQVRIK